MIRSLSRGLDIIAIFNKSDSASASEISKKLKMPRSTVYRILETLIEKGFIYQHSSDRRFRLTQKVSSLSDGYTDEDHMANISRKFLEKFTQEHDWPVTLATISGIDIVVRENTDRQSPFASEQFSIGYRMPILETASGLCMLAYMPIKRQKLILKTLAKTNNDPKKIANNTAVLEKKLVKILNQGFSVKNRARRFADLTAISVPIITEEEAVRGALTIRYSRSAIALEQAVAKFVPSLMKTSLEIASRINLRINKQQSLNNKESY